MSGKLSQAVFAVYMHPHFDYVMAGRSK